METPVSTTMETTGMQSLPQEEPVALRAAICKVTASICEQAYGKELRSIILAGSLARDEGTFVREADTWKGLGDAEFFLIFDEAFALPDPSVTASAVEDIERSLRARGIAIAIELSAVHPEYLRNLPPYILTHELRTTGKVIWGDRYILSLIPTFTSADIALEDAWRLLANRMVEQLDGIGTLEDPVEAVPPLMRYRTIKLFLDMATSLLVFLGAYKPSYRERAEALRRLAHHFPRTQSLPFAIVGFSERVSACTRFKLREEPPGSWEDQESLAPWEEAVTYARQLWRWELAQLAGVREGLSEHEAMRRWMKLEPWGKRLRGWAYILRKGGWYRSWRDWPHWLRRGWQASPRYWVYAVG